MYKIVFIAMMRIYSCSGRSSPVSTGRRKHRHKAACSKYGQTVHPRRLAQLSKTQNIERLLKLILVQGETIQNQISRLKERENQIEELEGEQHKNRVNVLGECSICIDHPLFVYPSLYAH